MPKYHVDILNDSGFNFKAKAGGFEFSIGFDKANSMNPPDVLLASLASCTGSFSVSASADLTETPPHRFKAINVSIDLKNANLDEKHKESLTRFIHNCPIHNTLKESPEIIVNLK